MAANSLAKTIASRVASESAQLAAIRSTKLRGAVLTNKLVTDAAWAAVYTAKSKVRLQSAQASVRRTMTETQMLHLLDVEPRESVIAKMVTNTQPTPAVLNRLRDDGHLQSTDVVEALARYWGHQLPVEWLSTLPGPVPGRLRVWLLRHDHDMTDADMATELDSFDEWGVGYDQPIIAWIIATRPGLIHHLVQSSSMSVRTQVAGSHLFGTLSVEEQERALDLHHVTVGSEKAAVQTLGQPWFNDRAYAWMAAGGNPTVHLELLPRLSAVLKHQDQSYGAQRNVDNRIKYRNWRVEAFDAPTGENEIAGLVQHVALGGKKSNGRPHAFPALAANPSLTATDAGHLANSFAQNSDSANVLWLCPEIQAAVVEMDRRFPGAGEATFTTWWQRLSDRFNGTYTEPAPNPIDVAETPQIAEKARPDYLECDGELLRWLEAQIGDNVDAWFVLYQVVDAFEGTVADLAVVAGAAA